MNDIYNMTFKRKFALNLYKNLKFTLNTMTFTSDFINGNNENMYPVLSVKGSANELIKDGKYIFDGENANITRLLGQHFPYATYEIKTDTLLGSVGIVISNKSTTIKISADNNGNITVQNSGHTDTFHSNCEIKSGMSLIITSRRNKFDIYFKDKKTNYITTFVVSNMQNIIYNDVFTSTTVGIYLSGNVVISEASSYIDCGIAQADIRPIRYENGDIIVENGKIYLTASIRMEEWCYQGIFSWIPTTSEFALTGALFYDAGDGIWGNDVAASIMYHRPSDEWYLWVCSFSHNHILGHAQFKGDIRFGLNVVDIELMEEDKESEETDFNARTGDEDPDFIYDKSSGKWYLTICRKNNEKKYKYYLYESSNPFKNYKYKGTTEGNDVTGGSIIKIDGKLRFICGSGFDKTAEYHIYDISDFDKYTVIKCDFHDGGFRGWGTIIPINLGSRTKYFWLTFDRYLPSEYKWSYGNIYCFEADKFN